MTRLYKGMQLDSLPVDQEEGSWRLAKNKVLNSKYRAISNELGVSDQSRKGSPGAWPNKKCIGSISIEEDVIYFFGSSNPIDSEIGIVRKGALLFYQPIIKDATSKVVLNFNENFPVSGKAQKKFNNNIIISFTDFNNNLRILNIDCIPFKIDVDYTINSADIDKAKALIKLFPDFQTPNLDPYNISVGEGQGVLTSGTYYPIVAYESVDGTVTPFTKVYNGIPIVNSNLNSDSSIISGGQVNESTGKNIRLTLTNVDNNYDKVRIGYIYSANNILTAYYENNGFIITPGISTLEVNITGSNRTQIDVQEALNPYIVYDMGKSITSLRKSLYIANLKQSEEFDFQTFANQIVVKWVRDRSVNITGQVKNGNSTFQNPTKIYFDKTFKSGECIALYVHFNLTNGVRTRAFHIPGRDFISGDRDVLNPSTSNVYRQYNDLDNNNPVYKYQILNTCTSTGATSGLMGFWENENELYPEDPNNPGNVHPDFSNIPGISFANRKVRHHVFPDLSFSALQDFVTGTVISTPGTYPVNDLQSKSFGIEISNLLIPSQFLPFVESWEISFAKRDNANIRIIAQDCISELSTSGAFQFIKVQPFDLMVSRPNLTPTFCKRLFSYTNDGAVVGQEINFVEDLYNYSKGDGNIFAVSEFFYGGENTTIPYPNTGRADNIRLKVTTGSLIGPLTSSADPTLVGVSQSVTLIDIGIYKRNMYLNFNTQTLVSTGVSFKVSASGIQATKEIFGGDCYINRYSQNPIDSGTKAFSWVVESASNIGYRNEDITQSKYFAPKYSNPTPSWFGYHTDYNANNSYNQIDIFYPDLNCNEPTIDYPFRVAFSLTEDVEGKGINWRIFKANSYYESERDKGEIWCVTGSDQILYIHHKFSLFVAQIKDKLNSNTGFEVYLGITDIFSRPAIDVLPVSEGFAGNQSQYATILCKLGYCFIDINASKVFIFNTNSGLKEISDLGLFNFFLDNSSTSSETDNPFNGIGYMLGYDTNFNRLVITKCDSGEGGGQFTLSFSEDANEGKGGWVSFHDYIPNVIVYNRTGFFGIDNSLQKIFKHNADLFNPCKFYNGTVKKDYVEFVETSEVTKRFDNIEWITTAENSGVNYPNITFTHLIVYNDSQCSGEISLKSSNVTWYSKDVRNVEGTFKFNDFRDMIKNISLPFIDETTFEVITSNIDTGKSWYNRSQFISKYVIFRMINDNTSLKNLHLSMVSTNFNKSTR